MTDEHTPDNCRPRGRTGNTDHREETSSPVPPHDRGDCQSPCPDGS